MIAWDAALDGDLRARFERCESFEAIAAALSRGGRRVGRGECIARAAALGLGAAQVQRVVGLHRTLSALPRPAHVPPAPVDTRSYQPRRRGPTYESVAARREPSRAERAQDAFAAGIGAAAGIAALAEAVEAHAARQVRDEETIADARRVLLGLAVIRLGLTEQQVAAVTGQVPLAVHRAKIETTRRLARLFVAPGAPLPVVLQTVLGPMVEARLTLREVKAAVARFAGVSVHEIEATRRTRAVVAARQLAMWVARLVTGHSLPVIGRAIGGRDHTTVLHGCRKLDRLGLAGFEPPPGASLDEIVAAAAARVGMKAVRR